MTKKPLVNFFPAECPATTTHRVKWWCHRRGPFCFGLIALKLLWRISNLGERWFNRQAVLGKIDFTRGRKLFLETALDRRNRCSLLYVGIFVGMGRTEKNLHYCFVWIRFWVLLTGIWTQMWALIKGDILTRIWYCILGYRILSLLHTY